MGYLVCDKCGGYYELQPGESPDDFDLTCNCGGELKFHNSLNNDDNGDIKPEIESIGVDNSYAEQKSSQYDSTIIIGAILGLIGLVGFFLISYLSVIILVIGIRLLLYGYNKKENWNKGIRGEQTVAYYLNQLPEDYSIFNDIKFPGSYGNLDHIVIGPNGIFVIETKNYKGFYIVKDKEWYYKNGSHIKKARSKPGKQVITNSMSLRKFLMDNNINMDGVWIDSIVTLINKNFKIEQKPRHYNVLFPSTIPKFIQNSNKKIDKDILKEAILLIKPYNKKNSYSDHDEKRVHKHKNSFMPVLPGFGWKKF
jgi:hypothetical protein